MIRIGSIVLRGDDLPRQPSFWTVERLKALGATEVHGSKRPLDADYVIVADPEGNRFCVADASGS